MTSSPGPDDGAVTEYAVMCANGVSRHEVLAVPDLDLGYSTRKAARRDRLFSECGPHGVYQRTVTGWEPSDV